jgi:hypothetical protein
VGCYRPGGKMRIQWKAATPMDSKAGVHWLFDVKGRTSARSTFGPSIDNAFPLNSVQPQFIASGNVLWAKILTPSGCGSIFSTGIPEV